MFRSTFKHSKHLAAAIAVVALAAPATSVALPREQIDNRYAVDAAIPAQEVQRNYEHLQSLDARRQAPGCVDHRSADAQDSGFVRSPEPATIVESPGFDWGDAGIGAGSVLGLLLISLSVMLSVVHRRNRAATT